MEAGRVLIAGPNDFVLGGEALETLTDRLAPRAITLNSLLVQDCDNDVSPAVVEQCEGAVFDTLSVIDRVATRRDLLAVIEHCWREQERDSEEAITSTVRDTRSGALRMVIGNLLKEGGLVMGEHLMLAEASRATQAA